MGLLWADVGVFRGLVWLNPVCFLLRRKRAVPSACFVYDLSLFGRGLFVVLCLESFYQFVLRVDAGALRFLG